MNSASNNTMTPTSGLEIGPRLKTISDYPLWEPKMSLYIKSLRKARLSDAACRKSVLNSIPDSKPFKHLGTASDILRALRTSYQNCFFHGFRPNAAGRYWGFGDICQYSCCEHCKSVKASVASLADNTLRPVISMSEKKDVLLLGRGTSPLLRVSVTVRKKDKTSQLRTFDMIARCGE